MPKLDSVLETSLYVDDLERAARFYSEVLGLKALTSDQRFHAYDVGGRSVLLIFRRGFTLETRPDVGAGAISPAIRIDTLVYGPLTPDEARHLVHQRREAAGSRAMAAGSPS